MQNKRPIPPSRSAPQRRTVPRPRPPRLKSPLMLAVIDILCIGICLMAFALFDHVIPQPAIKIEATLRPSAVPTAVPVSSEMPAASSEAVQPTVGPTEAPVTVTGDFSAKFADKFTTGEVISTENSYRSANVNITVSSFRDDENDQTYYIQDIYIRSIDCLRTCFAKDTFGKAIAEDVLTMSERNGAIAAINSDYYGYGNAGVVIRNGVLYRSAWEPGEEVLLIYRDGTMRLFKNESELDIDQALNEGAWQSFSFGPGLLDGNGGLRADGYERTNHDPRTLIGMVEPGHYMFVVIDGRQNGYARGMTYSESAKLCQSLGMTMAYNLDGGRTSQMTFLGQMTNRPYKDGRTTSDLIYIADIGA